MKSNLNNWGLGFGVKWIVYGVIGVIWGTVVSRILRVVYDVPGFGSGVYGVFVKQCMGP